MSLFEKYLSAWVLLCMGVGIIVGSLTGEHIHLLSDWSIANVNIPVAILVWLMIYPMMVQIDFSSLRRMSENWRGLGLTVSVNWLVKPFTMAFISYVFFFIVFRPWIHPETAQEYLAGAILLGAAPCTAMVFVWSYLTKGNPNYTLIQVSVNDLILLVAFVPIVGGLFSLFGIQFNDELGQAISIPYRTLISSTVIFVVIPLTAGYLSNRLLIHFKGEKWFQERFLKVLKPISIIALLATLILIFAFQGSTILDKPLDILLIAIPLTLQTYFIFFISWFSGKRLGLKHEICAPACMIGASNFFELAVAVAIALFGIDSGASLATVVGVLIEVPVMLSLVRIANKWQARLN
ncbi:MAG: ACR3 family arsenite efflux transporter [Bacteroidetes bacterium]|nr:MAG: ACR3 family arsenite efflux transporter [Bacteroidota bacterium]